MSLDLTLYNDGFAMVKDRRALDLPAGRTEQVWEGVAQTLEVATSSFSCDNAHLLEQNYRFDLVSRDVLLRKYLGREVELVQETHADDGKIVQERTRGRIMSIEDGRITSLDCLGRILLDPPGRVVLPSLPEGLLVEPSLVLSLQSPQGGASQAELRYLCKGLSWTCDYVAVLDRYGEFLDLDGLVGLSNRSGTSFREAKLQLVAGDVNRYQADPPKMHRVNIQLSAASACEEPSFQEQSLFEYHLYTLQRPTDLLDKEEKQVSLLSAKAVGFRRRYVFDPGIYTRFWWWRSRPDTDDGLKCAVVLQLENREENRLGMPLPRGMVRVYQADDQGGLQFVGEDRIDHTPRGESLRLTIGQAFDLRGKRTSNRSDAGKRVHSETVTVEIRSGKDEDVEVEVVESMVFPNWKVTDSTVPYEILDSGRIQFVLVVPARGAASLTYSVNGWSR